MEVVIEIKVKVDGKLDSAEISELGEVIKDAVYDLGGIADVTYEIKEAK